MSAFGIGIGIFVFLVLACMAVAVIKSTANDERDAVNRVESGEWD